MYTRRAFGIARPVFHDAYVYVLAKVMLLEVSTSSSPGAYNGGVRTLLVTALLLTACKDDKRESASSPPPTTPTSQPFRKLASAPTATIDRSTARPLDSVADLPSARAAARRLPMAARDAARHFRMRRLRSSSGAEAVETRRPPRSLFACGTTARFASSVVVVVCYPPSGSSLSSTRSWRQAGTRSTPAIQRETATRAARRRRSR